MKPLHTQPDAEPHGRHPLFALTVVAGVLFICGIAYSSSVHSPSIDETAHLAAGISHWDLGRFELYAVNPPLIRMIAGFPVTLMNPSLDWHQYSRRIPARSEFQCGRDFFQANGERTLTFFRVARTTLLPIALFGVLLCSIWSRDVSGIVAGPVAALLCLCSPTVLGHSAMLTPDVGAAVVGGWAAFRIVRWNSTLLWHESIGAGVFLGLAILPGLSATG